MGRIPKNAPDWYLVTHDELLKSGLKVLKNEMITKMGKENLVRLLMDMAIGPYHKTEDILIELYALSEQLVNEGFNLNQYIKWSNLIKENQQIMEILKEMR
jgi:hypothetical protein